MANHNQLSLLTTTQASLIDAALAARSLKVAEIVEVIFPSPTGRKLYSWWNLLGDSAYTTPLTDWLNGDTISPGFVAKDQNKAECFHTIPRTAALGDDVVQMEFVNYGRVFEGLANQHRGAKVIIWLFMPEIADDAAGTAYSAIWQFTGHLMRGGPANEDFVPMQVRSGIRSPNILVPSWFSGSNCQNYYNGHKVGGVRVFPTGLTDNPCDIDLHYGGTKGTVDPSTGELWASCNKTLDQGTNNCTAINGSLALAREIYGGDDYVLADTLIGYGDHKTRSSTIGNEVRLDNERVVYGRRKVKKLHVRRMAREYNPNPDNADQGTIRTVCSVSHGPIQSITDVRVLDHPLPRTDGLGLEVRLGTQRQAPTTYSDDMLSLNRIAHIRGDINPIDPTGVRPEDIEAECLVEGRNTINIYAADGSYTQGYTYNRIDCMVDYTTNKWYGYRMDVNRFNFDDIVYLRALNSNFHCDLQARTIQQQWEDTCRAAVGDGTPGWFRPFWFNDELRVLPILDTDLTDSDIPVIKSNFGFTRRVIIDPATHLPCIQPDKRDTLDIPNSIAVHIEDAAHDNIDRQITFNADEDQYEEGTQWGDESKRREPRVVDGLGLTTESEARILGEFLLKYGEFCTGGLLNNGNLKVTIPALWSVGLNLHQNKIVKFPSADNDRLEHYTDPDGNIFEFYLVTGMLRNSRLELEVTLQAWAGFSGSLCLCVPTERGALELDGALQAVFISEDWTIWPKSYSVWVKLTAYPASDGTIMALESGADFRLYVDSSGHLVWHSGSTTDTSVGTLSLDTWYHVALTAAAGASGAARKVYLNGVEVISSSGSDGSIGTPSAVSFYLGNDNGSLNGLECRLSAFHAWDAELSDVEVLADYNANCYEIDVVTGSIRYWFPMHKYLGGMDDGSGNGVLGSESGVYSTDFPTDLTWCSEPCTGESGTFTASGYVRWPSGDSDVIDGSHGVRTKIFSASADRGALGVTWPDTIDPNDITLDYWIHTVDALPSSGNSYFVGHPSPQYGFKVWYDGSLWVYRKSGIDSYPAGTVSPGDTLKVAFEAATPTRTYYLNSTLLYTDTAPSVDALNDIQAFCNTTGDYIGDIYFYAEYSGCTAEYAVQPVNQSGGSTTIGAPGNGSTTDDFDVLAYQVFDRPEDVQTVEIFSENL